MEAAQAPSSAKKRKLPSFMAVKPVKCAAHASQFLLFNPAQYHMFQLFRLGKSEKPDETDSDPNGASPARPKIPKKEPRQSKLPLKKPLPPTVAKMHRPEQAAASSSCLYVLYLRVSAYCLPVRCITCLLDIMLFIEVLPLTYFAGAASSMQSCLFLI